MRHKWIKVYSVRKRTLNLNMKGVGVISRLINGYYVDIRYQVLYHSAVEFSIMIGQKELIIFL